MKIAIVGYGKMGREVEAQAKARGHEVVCIIDVDNRDDYESDAFRSADVVIGFSTPDSAWDNIRKCWDAGLPVVSGTTGWQNELVWDEIEECCRKGATLLWAPNFSIGMNVTKAASRLLATLLSPYEEYQARIHEIHHVHKKDHPSGSAILLANGIVEACDRYDAWIEQTGGSMPSNAISVTHERQGEVAGIHEVTWDSPQDTISLRHEAKNRQGFALGAVVAAEWLAQAPKGNLYSMKDVLKTMI